MKELIFQCYHTRKCRDVNTQPNYTSAMNQAIQIENVLAREPTIFTISNMSFYVIEISNGIEYVCFGYK